MLMSELAAELKQKGSSMHDYLCDLHRQHGYHREMLINLFMEGSEGMAAMKRLMKAFRETPPQHLAGIRLKQIRDYGNSTCTDLSTGTIQGLEGPVGDLIIMDLEEEGNYVAVRPSGTEPKIKLYVFTRASAQESSRNLEHAKAKLEERLVDLESDMRDYAKVNA